MCWYEFEMLGWSWSVGYSKTLANYYAQAWRDLSEPVRVDGQLVYRECFTESDRSLQRAEANLQQRLRQVDGTFV